MSNPNTQPSTMVLREVDAILKSAAVDGRVRVILNDLSGEAINVMNNGGDREKNSWETAVQVINQSRQQKHKPDLTEAQELAVRHVVMDHLEQMGVLSEFDL